MDVVEAERIVLEGIRVDQERKRERESEYGATCTKM